MFPSSNQKESGCALKIANTGLLGRNWLCWCGNTTKRKGFYPCNTEGNFERELWGRGRFYACARCGRIIDPKNMGVVGLKRGFRVCPREVRNLIVCLQAAGIPPVGVGFREMLPCLTPRLYRSLGRFTPQV